MIKKAGAIFFILVISGSYLAPGMILLKYWYNKQQHSHEICYEISERSEYDKLKNNGDKYLLSLLKRTCKTNEEQNSKPPVWRIPVFVNFTISEISHQTGTPLPCEREGFYYIDTYTFLLTSEIFHPPSFV